MQEGPEKDALDFKLGIHCGDSYMPTKEYQNAIHNYSLSLNLHLDDALVLNRRAMAYFWSKQYFLLLQDAAMLIVLQPNDFLSYWFKAMGLWHLRQPFLAEPFIDKVLALDATNPQCKQMKQELIKTPKRKQIVGYHKYVCFDGSEKRLQQPDSDTYIESLQMRMHQASQWEERKQKLALQIEKNKWFVDKNLLDKLYTLKVWVANLQVPTEDGLQQIWRRVQAPGNISLHSLYHSVIRPVIASSSNDFLLQTIPAQMYPLEEYNVGDYGIGYGNDMGDLFMAVLDAHNYCLADVLYNAGDVMQLSLRTTEIQYNIQVEDIEPPKVQNLIACLAGGMSCPPTPVDTLNEYAAMLEIASNPGHVKYTETLTRLANMQQCKSFAPFTFNLEEAQKSLLQSQQDHPVEVIPPVPVKPRQIYVPPYRVVSVLWNCHKCKKGEKDAFECDKCQSVRYCSKQCQDADWPNHKKECKATQRRDRKMQKKMK